MVGEVKNGIKCTYTFVRSGIGVVYGVGSSCDVRIAALYGTLDVKIALCTVAGKVVRVGLEQRVRVCG
jgi:hypothetical protein